MEFLNVAWILIKTLKLGGFMIALLGVGVFGWYFIQINGLAAKGDSGEVPWESWRGPKAKVGLTIFAGGIALALLGAFLAAILPGRA
jgi:hypothetical protein